MTPISGADRAVESGGGALCRRSGEPRLPAAFAPCRRLVPVPLPASSPLARQSRRARFEHRGFGRDQLLAHGLAFLAAARRCRQDCSNSCFDPDSDPEAPRHAFVLSAVPGTRPGPGEPAPSAPPDPVSPAARDPVSGSRSANRTGQMACFSTPPRSRQGCAPRARRCCAERETCPAGDGQTGRPLFLHGMTLHCQMPGAPLTRPKIASRCHHDDHG